MKGADYSRRKTPLTSQMRLQQILVGRLGIWCRLGGFLLCRGVGGRGCLGLLVLLLLVSFWSLLRPVRCVFRPLIVRLRKIASNLISAVGSWSLLIGDFEKSEPGCCRRFTCDYGKSLLSGRCLSPRASTLLGFCRNFSSLLWSHTALIEVSLGS